MSHPSPELSRLVLDEATDSCQENTRTKRVFVSGAHRLCYRHSCQVDETRVSDKALTPSILKSRPEMVSKFRQHEQPRHSSIPCPLKEDSEADTYTQN